MNGMKKQPRAHFFAALLGLSMLFCLLAVPASAAQGDWAAGKADRINHETETGLISGTCTLWFTPSALLDLGVTDLDTLQAELAAEGSYAGYQGYYEGSISSNAYVGIGDGSRIYWYTQADFDYVNGFWNGYDTVMDWDTGVITCATGAVTALNGSAKPVAAATETAQSAASAPDDGGVDLLAGVRSLFAGIASTVRGWFRAA
jgi:hypothetical protein